MPGFVDTEASISPAACCGGAHRLRVSSHRKLSGEGLTLLRQYASYGTTFTGLAARSAGDARMSAKLLKVQGSLEHTATRIRDIAILPEDWAGVGESWFRNLKARFHAGMIEVTLEPHHGAAELRTLSHISSMAADEGISIRFLVHGRLRPETLRHAVSSMPVAISDHGAEELLKASEFTQPSSVLSFTASSHVAARPEIIRLLLNRSCALSFSCGQTNMQDALFSARTHFGLSAEEAITAATYNGACGLDAAGTTGSLEPGKFADLIILAVPDYRDTGLRIGASDVTLSMRGGMTVFERVPLNPD